MKKSIWSGLLLVCAVALAACGNSEEEPQGYPQLEKGITEETVVEMTTSEGTMRIRLFPEIAPKAVENFLGHAESGYYEGIIFHRVIEDFMLQTGDPTGTGGGGESIYGEPFEDEFSDRLFNFRGALSMANAGPGTNGSQFFIVQASEIEAGSASDYPEEITAAYEEMGGTPWLDGMHTVFGQVDEGMDVVDKIAAVEKGANDKPLEDIVIESIEIIE
ncbi:peptidylprolyl isomerase [Planococcus maritimus]|uniref:peptidylprolyl isomerase n=1 Tax=Planococcus maritimus TaxID=192421 RepID=UPI00079B2CF7|nr:peptidylprolyl isomerase [Planococcus maritimus]KYG57621.1 peptidylprolyl isomerase [Planococcus maritimus]OED31244.1 peptidylprolyl isomerase [Planococcus maritimus]